MSQAANQILEFDPLAVENVGVTLAAEFLQQPVAAFPPADQFSGPGVYALYYQGTHAAYAPLVELDDGACKFPVYVGKASRSGTKQGFNPAPSRKTELWSRIKKHHDSVTSASNLSSRDFRVRYLVLKPAYIDLAESVMIRVFRPPWNGMGLGSNETGGKRMTGAGSFWDSLHPGRKGRPAGTEETARLAADAIRQRVEELHSPSPDPVLRRMHDRIMKFV